MSTVTTDSARQPVENVVSTEDGIQSFRFTVQDYERAVQAGIFNNHKVELLYGEIVRMTPINPPHAYVVDQLMYWSVQSTNGKDIWVRIQNALGIPEFNSMPEPDVAWMAKRNYRDQHPQPEDVKLIIEVSDSTVQTERSVKGKLYAQAGLQDYWIINLRDLCVEVYRDPKVDHFQNHQTFQMGQTVSPLAVPEVKLEVTTLMQG